MRGAERPSVTTRLEEPFAVVLRTGAEPPGVIARRFTVPAQVEGGGGSKEPTAPAAKAETMKNCERIATTGCRRCRVVRRIERAYATLVVGAY